MLTRHCATCACYLRLDKEGKPAAETDTEVIQVCRRFPPETKDAQIERAAGVDRHGKPVMQRAVVRVPVYAVTHETLVCWEWRAPGTEPGETHPVHS